MFHFYPNMNAYTSKTRIQLGPDDYAMYNSDSEDSNNGIVTNNNTKLKDVNIGDEVSVTIPEKPPQVGGTREHTVEPTVVQQAAVEPQLNRS